MTATNHAVTGAVIAIALQNYWVALPAALISHFALDILPHYGYANTSRSVPPQFLRILVTDICLVFILLIWLLVLFPSQWYLAVGGALLAMSPDVMWIPYFLSNLRGNYRPLSKLANLHKRIQWAERPWAIWIELLWLVLFLSIVWQQSLAN